MSQILLVIFVGLPGSGKTSLCMQLQNSSPPDLQYILVSYDDLIPRFSLDVCDIESGEWKRWRKLVFECVEHLILPLRHTSSDKVLSTDHHQILSKLPEWNGTSDAVVFLLDDNFYYSSMRHPFSILAKRYGLSFASIACCCPYPICLERNSHRLTPVPQSTICKMNQKIEWPDPNRNIWEKFSLTLNLLEPLGSVFCDAFVLPFLRRALSEPFSCAEVSTKEELRMTNRLINLNSIMHQVDNTLRREVRDVMSSHDSLWRARHSHTVCEFKRNALDAIRSSIMHDFSVRSLEDYFREAVFTFRNALRNIMLEEG